MKFSLLEVGVLREVTFRACASGVPPQRTPGSKKSLHDNKCDKSMHKVLGVENDEGDR